nr:PREDICTED: uncharacterized protein LOC109042485 [Bemisia tabaci]
MAEIQNDVKFLKGSKVLVKVDEALKDMLVVTYNHESRIYQGVLMDTTNRQFPCGVNASTSFFAPLTAKQEEESEKLYSVSQRCTYLQEKSALAKNLLPINGFSRSKGATRGKTRMTVRLRPRQVLCSKCRGICNENSENVDHSKSHKPQPVADRRLSSPEEKSPRSLFAESQQDNQPKSENSKPLLPLLIPKVSRVKSSDISNMMNCTKLANKIKPVVNGKIWMRPQGVPVTEPDETMEDAETVCVMGVEGGENSESIDNKMVLRKKRSVGSMEDLWDESVFEDALCKTRTTPVIKISFGTEGEGTVVKIPSKVNYEPSESEPEVDIEAHSSLGFQESNEAQSIAVVESANCEKTVTRAAKRALKKAKKEAKRKMLVSSPSGRSPTYEALYYRRHRHKVKHKKRRKEDRPETYSAMKERCLHQKLSIHLKRLNANAYTTRNELSSSPNSHSSEEPDPEFPPIEGQLKNLENTVSSCTTVEGCQLTVGDIIWGKIHGFPWWPGKVLSITKSTPDASDAQAYIAWFGSSTTSVMSCDQLAPFLETYKSRYNKKKKSRKYKEAIRQATSEATALISQNIESIRPADSNSMEACSWT